MKNTSTFNLNAYIDQRQKAQVAFDEARIALNDICNKIAFEDKPFYKVGDKVFCIPLNKEVVISEAQDNRDMGDQFRLDAKDGMCYELEGG